jgi:hypothetical protein
MRKEQLKGLFFDVCMVGFLVGMLACSVDALGQQPQKKPIEKQDSIGLTNWTSDNKAAYIAPVHPHGEPTLAGRTVQGAQPPKAVFLCPSSGFACSMVSFEGKPQGLPVSLCIGLLTPQNLPPYLAVSSKLITHNTQGKTHA